MQVYDTKVGTDAAGVATRTAEAESDQLGWPDRKTSLFSHEVALPSTRTWEQRRVGSSIHMHRCQQLGVERLSDKPPGVFSMIEGRYAMRICRLTRNVSCAVIGTLSGMYAWDVDIQCPFQDV